jgi:hypothetical protein
MSQTLTFNAGSGDCWAKIDDLDTGSPDIFLARHGGGAQVRAWLPFASVSLPRLVVITSAVVRWTASDDRPETTVSVNIRCEAADNPSTPASEGDLLGRSVTSATLATNLVAYTAGTLYSYDITSAVQEVLNRAGWASANTLAVIIDNDGTTSNKRRLIAGVEHSTYPQAVLEITVPTYFPRNGGVI